jgi:nitrogenase molybdenum-iron protein NifN
MKKQENKYVSTTNACKLCKPMGACLAFKGIEGAVPFLHGSQGCATYMRRYIISHFNEPMDIASSSLGEKHAVFGGAANLKKGLKNVCGKFSPSMIGVATTCLTETIGDDVPMILREYKSGIAQQGDPAPFLVNVSTPSYSGTHMEGFHEAVKAVVEQLAEGGEPLDFINLFPGFVSPADIRHLYEIVSDFNLECVILPDYSDTLDGPAMREYERIPQGGTPVSAIKEMGRALGSIEFGRNLKTMLTAGEFLKSRFEVVNRRIGTPIGLRETDAFFTALEEISGMAAPQKYMMERARLIDSFVDCHKYVFGKRAVVYGEEDLVTGITSFLTEIGIQPILCASGGKGGVFQESIKEVTEGIFADDPDVRDDADFYDIAIDAESMQPDIMIGHSKGYPLARKLGIPLIRVGFPIHDRIGGQRIVHIGYRGAQNLLDTIVNAIIEKKQDDSSVGYSYM